MHGGEHMMCVMSPGNVMRNTAIGGSLLTGRWWLPSCGLGLYAPYPQVLVLRSTSQQHMSQTCIVKQPPGSMGRPHLCGANTTLT